MKKKIVAILATIAAVFGFGFAANTAMAVDYGSINGNATASRMSSTVKVKENKSISPSHVNG